MEKYDFIKLMLKSRNLSVNEKKRLVLLATKEMEKKESTVQEGETYTNPGEKPTNMATPHFPKDTAAFLSLFNHEEGFKFLTHAFDPDSEMEYDHLLKLARDKFLDVTKKNNANSYIIPKSLYALMRNMLFGGEGKTWMDSNGKFHPDNFACNNWIDWAKENPRIHILSNESIKKTIMDFRSTIRLVISENSDSRLETIIRRQIKKHANLIVDMEKLDNNSDFYTYVNYLEKGLTRILDDLSKYSKETPKVKISYESSRSGDYKLCTIKILQYGSFSIKPIEDAVSKFQGGGGDFYSIRNILCGYCNWSVESKWNDKPLRWNILDDTGKNEIEEIASDTIPGFTHILTFYSKLK